MLQALCAALKASQSAAKSAAPQVAAAVPQADIKLSPATEHPSSQLSPHVINRDCYMVVDSDNDADALLDLDGIVLEDVMMMTDEHEVVHGSLLI